MHRRPTNTWKNAQHHSLLSVWEVSCCCYVTSVVSDCVRPHRRQPTRLPRPWDSPGKNPGVGCHFLLQCRKVKSESEVAQSCPTLSDPMDCSLPGSSIHGIFQARVLEWGAIAFSIIWTRNVLLTKCAIKIEMSLTCWGWIAYTICKWLCWKKG